jgi:hypothetical protein
MSAGVADGDIGVGVSEGVIVCVGSSGVGVSEGVIGAVVGPCVGGKFGMAVGIAEGGTVGAAVIVGGGVADGVGVAATGCTGEGMAFMENKGVITAGEKMSAGAERISSRAERGTDGATSRNGKIR